jgi:hypothetical protein
MDINQDILLFCHFDSVMIVEYANSKIYAYHSVCLIIFKNSNTYREIFWTWNLSASVFFITRFEASFAAVSIEGAEAHAEMIVGLSIKWLLNCLI